MNYRLYVDDIRNPKTNHDWVVTRNSEETIEYMIRYGCPEFISFDHDLGGDDTSMRVVKWMIEMDLDMGGEFIPYNFEFNVHSANPVGAANINGILSGYMKQK